MYRDKPTSSTDCNNPSDRPALFESERTTYQSPDSGTSVLCQPTEESGDRVRIETDHVSLEADADDLTVAQAVRIADGGDD